MTANGYSELNGHGICLGVRFCMVVRALARAVGRVMAIVATGARQVGAIAMEVDAAIVAVRAVPSAKEQVESR